MYKITIDFAGGTSYETYFLTRETAENYEKAIMNPETIKKYNGFIEIDNITINVQNINTFKIQKMTKESEE